jgi:hypothetical protein
MRIEKKRNFKDLPRLSDVAPEPVEDATIKLAPAMEEAPKPTVITMPEPEPQPAPHENPNSESVDRVLPKNTRDEIAAGQATLRKYSY